MVLQFTELKTNLTKLTVCINLAQSLKYLLQASQIGKKSSSKYGSRELACHQTKPKENIYEHSE
jgi:hypothetical protein